MLLAHDLGTTGDKASLHDDDGSLVASVTVGYPTRFAHGGVAEQDPEQWWDAFCAATRTLLDRTGTAADAINGIGFSGQMMGLVPLGQHRQPLGLAIIWADHRSASECQRLVDRIGMSEAYRITGHRLDPTYTLSKLMWLRDHDRRRYDSLRTVCQAKDFVAFRLTNVLVTDPSDASSTNAFDQRSGRWSDELIAAADVDARFFPDIVPSTTVLGPVTATAADATGLRVGTPVVIGGGDGPLAAIGAGVTGAADGAYTYLGSSSWISLAANDPLHDPQMRTMTFNHVVPGRYVPTATMQSGGGALQWIAELLAPDEGESRFARLVADAETAEASDEGLYFLPHLLGERSPYWNPAARGAFVGLARHHGPAHLTRAVLEGVAFNLATCVEAFREAGTPVERVDAVGGGAVSDVWLQILADVWGCTIRRRTIVEEANSLGAAVTTAVGLGLVPDFSVAASLSEVTHTFEPDAERRATYARRHAVFLDAYTRLEPWCATATEDS